MATKISEEIPTASQVPRINQKVRGTAPCEHHPELLPFSLFFSLKALCIQELPTAHSCHTQRKYTHRRLTQICSGKTNQLPRSSPITRLQTDANTSGSKSKQHKKHKATSQTTRKASGWGGKPLEGITHPFPSHTQSSWLVPACGTTHAACA